MAKAIDRTELQDVLEVMIGAGHLDLQKRKTVQFPCHFNKEFEDQSIEFVTQDQRAINGMKRAGIMTVGQLIERFDELRKIRNLGEKSVTLLHLGLMNLYYQSLETVEKKAEWIKQIIDMNNGTCDPAMEEN